MPSRDSTAASAPARALLIAALLGTACTGAISGDLPEDPTAPGGSLDPNKGKGTEPDPNRGKDKEGKPTTVVMPPSGGNRVGICKTTFDPGPSPLRLMTRVEYDNTVRDLLGDMRHLADQFPPDGRPARGYQNDANARAASDLLVDGYMKAAEQLAAAAVGQLPKILDCDPGKAGEMACLGQFFDTFGKRAFRRPLTALEKDNLTGAFKDGRTKGFADGIEAVMTVMLISPQFLYRYEQGVPVTGTNFAQLTSWEVASRLSYLLWGSMPDGELIAAADGDKLTKPEEVLTQARRMTSDPRFMATVSNFMDQYLELDQLPTLDKDTQTLPAWKEEMRGPMRVEAQKFFEHVLKEEGGKLGALLTAQYTFVNGPLASFYGLNGVTGDAFKKVPLDTSKASGFFTQGGWLSVHGTPDNGLTSLVFRGKFVREELLCQHVPDPPPNAQDDNPPFDEKTTTSRQWAEARMAKPVCGSCHVMTDHIGYGFENYDAIGKWRTLDRMTPVDASGKLTMSDADGAFTGVPELGKKLAGSQMVSDCMSTQWFRFAAGRTETERDVCNLSTLQGAMNGSGGDLRELFVAFTQTDSFLFRSKGDAQ